MYIPPLARPLASSSAHLVERLQVPLPNAANKLDSQTKEEAKLTTKKKKKPKPKLMKNKLAFAVRAMFVFMC